MIKRAYPDGVDCVWIGSDSDGHLGAFVTGGVAPIPIRALNSDVLPVEEAEKAVCQLPSISETQLLVSMKRPDDYVAIAERGFFVYDWCDVERTERESTKSYEQLVVPLSPIRSHELPEPLAQLVAHVRFSGLVFSEAKSVNVLEQFECYSGR